LLIVAPLANKILTPTSDNNNNNKQQLPIPHQHQQQKRTFKRLAKKEREENFILLTLQNK
jgi:hypothetical protein